MENIIESTRKTGDVLKAANDSISLKDVFKIASSAAFNKLRWNIMQEGNITILPEGLNLLHVLHDAKKHVKSGITLFKAAHWVNRNGEEVVEEIPGIVEICMENEQRNALILRGPDERKYTVTMKSSAVYGDSPISLNKAGYETTAHIMKRLLGKWSIKPSKADGKQLLYTSPGASTNQVEIESFVLEGPGALSKKDFFWVRIALARKGLSLKLISDVASETSDMATFMQMVEGMGSDELKDVLEKRNERQTEQETILDEVPRSFIRWANLDPEFSEEDMRFVRKSPVIRKLHAKLVERGFDNMDIEWLFITAKTNEETKEIEREVKFAVVNNFRRATTGEREVAPMMIRGDAVSGALLLGNEVARVTQVRLAPGLSKCRENIAGMCSPNDRIGNKEDARKRLMEEIHEETGISIEIIQKLKTLCQVTGLYPSENSIEEIYLAVLKGAALTGEERNNALHETNGLAVEHEAVNLSLDNVEKLDMIIKESIDLKSRLLAILLKKLLEVDNP